MTDKGGRFLKPRSRQTWFAMHFSRHFAHFRLQRRQMGTRNYRLVLLNLNKQYIRSENPSIEVNFKLNCTITQQRLRCGFEKIQMKANFDLSIFGFRGTHLYQVQNATKLRLQVPKFGDGVNSLAGSRREQSPRKKTCQPPG